MLCGLIAVVPNQCSDDCLERLGGLNLELERNLEMKSCKTLLSLLRRPVGLEKCLYIIAEKLHITGS